MITVILNCYKRPEYLKEQVEAIKKQTIKPDNVWLWINQAVENEALGMFGGEWGFDRVFRSSVNCKYHARFALGLLAETDYVAFFDDDTIPGEKWFENCLDSMKERPGIYGGAGVVMATEDYTHHIRIGWPSRNEVTTEVDLVGHAWFLRREDLNYLWREIPMSFHNCEDIQLSYLAQKYGNVKTYCPPHPASDYSLHSSLKPWQYGNDMKASSNGSLIPFKDFYNERNRCVQIALSNGWKTVNSLR